MCPWPACRSTLTRVLAKDAVQVAGTPHEALVLAYLRRLARDKSILLLEVEAPFRSAVNRARHRIGGQACTGCSKCDGPVWAFKTETVARLWTNFCKPCPPVHSESIVYMCSVHTLYGCSAHLSYKTLQHVSALFV